MADWRQRLTNFCGPGVLAGITFGDWLGLLRQNRFVVHPCCWARAGAISWQALLNSLGRLRERRLYETEWSAAEVRAPLFVLGHWRSGTTLLHDLLAVDDRFACPTLYQVMYPHTFATSEKLGATMLRLLAPRQRPQDNMRLDPSEAWEDEFAMCVWGMRSTYLSWAFPKGADAYDRFLTFRDASKADVERWQQSLGAFLRKLTWKHGGKPLILKSPTHTCRIRLLLEMFPDARFVHIHRDPYTVFQSSLHLYDKILPMIRLQRTDRFDWAGRVIRQYNEMHGAFFEERPLIPAGRFHEVRFAELERDPMAQVRGVYEALGLPEFGYFEAKLRDYVATLSGYKKNVHRELYPEQRERVAKEWRICFEQFGYPI
jgi:hypothetical protein